MRVLPDRIGGSLGISLSGAPVGPKIEIPPEGLDFEKEIADAECRYLRMALEKSDGVRTKAAELLKISYRSFRHYAKKHNI